MSERQTRLGVVVVVERVGGVRGCEEGVALLLWLLGDRGECEPHSSCHFENASLQTTVLTPELLIAAWLTTITSSVLSHIGCGSVHREQGGYEDCIAEALLSACHSFKRQYNY